MSLSVLDVWGPDGFGAYEVDWEGGPSFTRVNKKPHGLLIPGFIDIHVHGAFGIDFMSCTEKELGILCDKLAAQGYEGFLPTTITATAAEVASALEKLTDHEMILGFHLEGPFLSPNYPGAQPRHFIVDPPLGRSEWDPILDHPKLRVITIAPERPGALELTSRLIQRGVIVSIGHTDATYEEARRGYEFGASHATHTFNAMRPFHHREAGTVGYVLQNEDIHSELIYDRHHVCKESAALLLRCKSPTGVIAVSDGTMASGMPPGTKIEMWGLSCIVGRGEVRLESGALAGSSITLLDAFRNLHEDFGAETAIQACCLNPRRALRMGPEPKVWVELNSKLEIVQRYVHSG